MEFAYVISIYKGCLFFGIAFSVLTLFLGNFLDDALDGLFDAALPGDVDGSFSLIVTFLSIFGGTGLLLEYNFSLAKQLTVIVSLLSGFCITSAFYFLYLKPMKENENSVAFFLSDLQGNVGEVTVPVSGNKYGEVFIKAGAGRTNQIALSSSGEEIAAGAEVIVDYVREGILYVSKYNIKEED